MDFGNWRDRAACLGTDTELYFPVSTAGAEQAKMLCQQCPVITQCLDWALTTGQHDGIWGGRTEDERRTLRRARQRAGTRR
jgi:WhiB family transcriptional regulator, redox-sensing transcriptional regulator